MGLRVPGPRSIIRATGELHMMTSTDRIEKTTIFRAPLDRVWNALANADEFGTWFRMKFDGPFQAGRSVHGHLTSPKYQHISFEFIVEKIEPKRLFSYRWHPYAMDEKVDYSAEP